MEDGACHNSCLLFGQAGQPPFSNYIIQPDETGVTGAIANRCVQLRKLLLSLFCSIVQFFSLLYDLVWHLACGIKYLQCQ